MKTAVLCQSRFSSRVTTAVLLLLASLPMSSVHAESIAQQLRRGSSSIRFGVDSPSPTLKMNGTFSKYSGTLQLNPEDLTKSSVRLELDVGAVQLPPDQVIQAVFLQTALAHLRQNSTTFQSTSISRYQGSTYLVSGNYLWGGKTREATVPITILKATPSATEIRLLLDGSLKDKQVPSELSSIGQGASGSKGWVKANLVFLR